MSYAQCHFWYFIKLVYPRYLCFDYGYACLPTIHSWLDWRNLCPLASYSVLIALLGFALSKARPALLVGLGLTVIPLVNIN